MKALDDLREMLCKELDEIGRKKELSAGDLETAHKLTDTIKNIDKICLLEEQGGYSSAGDMAERGYSRDSSYANRGKHYVRSHYSRDGYDDDGSYRGGNSRNYSRDAGRMVGMLEEMMQCAGNDREREAIRRCLNELREG